MVYEYRLSEMPPAYRGETPYDGTVKVARLCTNCGVEAPAADSENSLISKRGWRLVLETDALGRRIGSWRCPTCWSHRRRALRNSMRAP
jgi:hypothetical protein